MIVLLGILLGGTLLFFWLGAFEFARPLMFLAMAFAFVCITMLIMPGRGAHYLINWAFMGSAVVIAWPVSGIPLYIQRIKQRAMVRRYQQIASGASFKSRT